ncbi:MAG: MCE family protein [Gemmatimonadales bacterium]|nr:MCE family protein [Gemmatimonadales bacterium]
MDLRYSREVTVGTIVIMAILVFVFGTMWLSGRSVGSGDSVRIQFANVSGLKRASPVRISGVPVGKVQEITFVDVGRVLVTVSLPDQVQPKVDAEAEIVSISLVGDYAVDFNPGQAAQLLPEGRIIRGRQEKSLAGRAEQLGDRADSLLLGAQAIVNQRTADQLHATMDALQGTLKAARQTMEMYSNPRTGPTAQLTRTLATLQQLGARLDSALANPALSRTLTRADTLTANVAAMTSQLTSTGARLDTLLLGINQGQGTLGKFATDSGLYRDMRELSQSMQGLVNELQKNPGKIGVTVKLF